MAMKSERPKTQRMEEKLSMEQEEKYCLAFYCSLDGGLLGQHTFISMLQVDFLFLSIKKLSFTLVKDDVGKMFFKSRVLLFQPPFDSAILFSLLENISY